MLENIAKPSSSWYPSYPPMSISGIQGQLLEVTVVGCNKLKDTEWISRQDPYVCVEYGSTKYRTRTCTDGGKNPTFQEKFVFTLIEGLREFTIVVWNSNTLTFDDFIGNGKVQLQKVLSQGYDDSPWPLQDKRGKYAGEIRLIMHYANANKPGKTHAPSAPSAPHYAGTPQPQAPLYSAPPPAAHYPPTSYPPQPLYPSYAPNAPGYPPPPYHQPAAYPPAYPPTSSYPPHPSYPPPPQSDPYFYPPGSYPSSHYPPPPY
ncbi:elicitor-responsive protein 1 [Phtheirospermum japonicum]|uniref:Elicitor-responsive protein 1 n=1 Tax=Phtheirospermum japonicum TaxID=374723 RepID=A0A830BHL0_9LAMI|nr:elicitor-responsive protein 1 [Phtheirospermum japonicum]